jgi:hypothetical protein
MHLSEVDVKGGRHGGARRPVGEIRQYRPHHGPHLHWAVKWRNPEASNRGDDFYIDPALLLDLPVTD